jgi:hypothetical protein
MTQQGLTPAHPSFPLAHSSLLRRPHLLRRDLQLLLLPRWDSSSLRFPQPVAAHCFMSCLVSVGKRVVSTCMARRWAVQHAHIFSAQLTVPFKP